jgi:hypothetical protein
VGDSEAYSGRRVARVLLTMVLVVFFVVRFVIRQYVRKELAERTVVRHRGNDRIG